MKSPTLNTTFHEQSKDFVKSIREDNCCTVKALAVVTGEPLDKCFEFMRLNGRITRRGMTTHQIKEALSKSKKYTFVYRNFEKPITINQFCKQYPVGSYYVCVRGHAFSIIDGVVYDFIDKPLRRIRNAWRVYVKN